MASLGEPHIFFGSKVSLSKKSVQYLLQITKIPSNFNVNE